jgi:hypothetical protein
MSLSSGTFPKAKSGEGRQPNNRLKHDGGDSAIKMGCTHLEVGSDPKNDLIPPAAA